MGPPSVTCLFNEATEDERKEAAAAQQLDTLINSSLDDLINSRRRISKCGAGGSKAGAITKRRRGRKTQKHKNPQGIEL